MHLMEASRGLRQVVCGCASNSGNRSLIVTFVQADVVASLACRGSGLLLAFDLGPTLALRVSDGAACLSA